MSETGTVTPPATAVWYDQAATTDNVLAILRLTEQDVDRARVEAAVPAAATLIDNVVDRPEALVGPPPPAAIQTELEQATIDIYRGRVPTVQGFGSSRLRDTVRAAVLHEKQRWGVS